MHSVKVAFLLVLTLAVMRSGSWLVGWAAFRLTQAPALASTLVGNTVAFGLFLVFLLWNAMPGEALDIEATIFGAVVFGVFQLIDLKWQPWRRRAGADEG